MTDKHDDEDRHDCGHTDEQHAAIDGIPDPEDMVNLMVTLADMGTKLEDMPRVGYFAGTLADAIAHHLDGEDTTAYLMGTSVVNMLVQEAILQTHMAALECSTVIDQNDPDAKVDAMFYMGIAEGVKAVADLMAKTIEGVVSRGLEVNVVDNAFESIVENFRLTTDD